MTRLAPRIEAILYLKGKPLSLNEIAEYAGCDRDTAEEGLIELMADYAHRDSALEVVETSDGYTLQLREAFQSLIDTIIPVDLGIGALRTLAAVALKGSIAQTDLVNLRGSGAYQHVQELVEKGFVRKRRQADGRSYWVQVTDKFHQYFQIERLPDQLLLRAVNRPKSAVDADSEVIDAKVIETEESTEIVIEPASLITPTNITPTDITPTDITPTEPSALQPLDS